jgi:hypothetical protein
MALQQLEPFQLVFLQRAGEEQALERIGLLGDIVLPVKIVLVENLGENLFRQDVLDQHFPHILRRHRGADGLLRMFEKLDGGVTEGGVFVLRLFDHRAEGFEDGWQIGLKLRHRLAELGDLGPLIVEEEIEQPFQRVRVVDRAAHHLLSVLDQNGGRAVFEDDVVLGIALEEFLGDFLVEIVRFVLGLPIAERQAQVIEQRAVD